MGVQIGTSTVCLRVREKASVELVKKRGGVWLGESSGRDRSWWGFGCCGKLSEGSKL